MMQSSFRSTDSLSFIPPADGLGLKLKLTALPRRKHMPCVNLTRRFRGTSSAENELWYSASLTPLHLLCSLLFASL